MSSQSMFADSFEIAECACTRRTKPSGQLRAMRVHKQFDLPGEMGRGVLDMFLHERAIVARVVSMKSGEVAWYDVTVPPARSDGRTRTP